MSFIAKLDKMEIRERPVNCIRQLLPSCFMKKVSVYYCLIISKGDNIRRGNVLMASKQERGDETTPALQMFARRFLVCP